MPLSDKGITEIQDGYFDLGSMMEGYLSQLDKIMTSEDFEDPSMMYDVLDLMIETIQEYGELIDDVYQTELISEEELDED
jgi:hypothetical protein